MRLTRAERRLVREILAGPSKEPAEIIFGMSASALQKAIKRRGSDASAASSIKETLHRLEEFAKGAREERRRQASAGGPPW